MARSAAAAAVRDSARPPIARSRSSAVLTSSLASISALRAAVQRSARSSRAASILRLVRLVEILQLLGLGELGAELLQPGQVLLGRLPGRGDGAIEPRGLLARGAGRPGQPAKPAGDLGRGRVGLVPAGLRLRHRLPGVLLGLGRDRQLAGGLIAAQLGLGQARGRLVGGGPHLEQALRPGAAALRPVGPEQVTVPGHGLKTRIFPNEPACLLQVRGHHYVAQKLGRGLRQPVGRAHQLVSRDTAPGRVGLMGLRGLVWRA